MFMVWFLIFAVTLVKASFWLVVYIVISSPALNRTEKITKNTVLGFVAVGLLTWGSSVGFILWKAHKHGLFLN